MYRNGQLLELNLGVWVRENRSGPALLLFETLPFSPFFISMNDTWQRNSLMIRKMPAQSLYFSNLTFFPWLSSSLYNVLPSLGICKRNPRYKLWFKTRFQSKSNCGSSVWMGLQLEIIGAKMLIGTVYRWRLGIVLLLCSNIPSFLLSILCLYDSNKLILVLFSDFYIVIFNND